MIISNEQRLYDTILSLDLNKEIIGWTEYLNPSQSILNFFDIRKTPEAYVEKELEWYESQSLDVAFIETYAKMWTEIKSTENLVNSNYGWCIFSEENGHQFDNVLNKLLKRPQTKQACMIYTRPTMHTDAFKNGMKDFLCTNYVQCFIRDLKLIYIVHQRSCDFFYGLFNDFAWHCYVYHKLLKALRDGGLTLVETNIIYHCDTLHVYPRHYDKISRIADEIRKIY